MPEVDSASSLPTRDSRSPMNIVAWVLQALLAIAFLLAGSMILKGGPKVTESFAKVGIGQWFRFVTGALEIIGGILLLVPSACGVGALLIGCIMAVAILLHLTRLGGSPLAAVVMLALAAFIAWFRRDRTAALLGSRPPS